MTGTTTKEDIMARQIFVAIVSFGLTAAMIATTIAPQPSGFIV